jgi:hypothetical protein
MSNDQKIFGQWLQFGNKINQHFSIYKINLAYVFFQQKRIKLIALHNKTKLALRRKIIKHEASGKVAF